MLDAHLSSPKHTEFCSLSPKLSVGRASWLPFHSCYSFWSLHSPYFSQPGSNTWHPHHSEFWNSASFHHSAHSHL